MIAVAVLLAPVAAILTILILPLWSWIEATFGIESIGHSGPASWCYAATYLTSLLTVVAVVLLVRTRRRAKNDERTKVEKR